MAHTSQAIEGHLLKGFFTKRWSRLREINKGWCSTPGSVTRGSYYHLQVKSQQRKTGRARGNSVRDRIIWKFCLLSLALQGNRQTIKSCSLILRSPAFHLDSLLLSHNTIAMNGNRTRRDKRKTHGEIDHIYPCTQIPYQSVPLSLCNFLFSNSFIFTEKIAEIVQKVSIYPTSLPYIQFHLLFLILYSMMHLLQLISQS